MTFADSLRVALQNDEAAVEFLTMVREVSHTWDDLIDKDRDVTPAQIHRAFWIAFVGLRENPFFARHQPVLLPILEVGIFNFIASCDLERQRGHSRQLAHTARYAVGDVAMVVARLVGGLDWALAQAPALKLLMQPEAFELFDKEMEVRYAQDNPAS